MKLTVLFILLFYSLSSHAQKFSTYVGLGAGGQISEKLSWCSRDKQAGGHFAITGSLYYSISSKYQIGFEAISGSNIRVMGGSNCNVADVPTNTLKLDPYNPSASNLLLRNKFSFTENKKANPYVDLGAGFTFFSKI